MRARSWRNTGLSNRYTQTPNRVSVIKFCLILFLIVIPMLTTATENQECVILLHGMCRTSRSMEPMAKALSAAGYRALNVDYPSRTAAIEPLSEEVIGRAVADAMVRRAPARLVAEQPIRTEPVLGVPALAEVTKIHFVTHSLGGILVRSYLSRHTLPNLGRVVMLGPPNQGSEVVDQLGGWWLFKKLNGPAGNELGTDNDSTPNRLGPANFCVGVIAGNRSINWINSLLIPGPDDGKVSVTRTKLAGMADHLVLRATHPYLMRNSAAIKQTIHFLRTGRFERNA